MKRLGSTLFLAAVLASTSVFGGVYDDMLKAVNTRDVGTVSSLLQRGMDVNTTDSGGNSLLMLAAQNGDLAMVETLLSNRANTLIRNKYGDSALMLAALRGHLKIAVALVAAGAEIDPKGWTPLAYAAFGGQIEVVQFLLTLNVNVDTQAGNGMTALMAAARHGNLAIVRLLLKHGADGRLRDQDKKTALGFAQLNMHAEVADVLRDAGRDD